MSDIKLAALTRSVIFRPRTHCARKSAYFTYRQFRQRHRS